MDDKSRIEEENDDHLAKWLESRRNQGLFDCVDEDLTLPRASPPPFEETQNEGK
ncbi:MAG: hypothetical protein QM784_29460 [Polyangiaceae bacterium]